MDADEQVRLGNWLREKRSASSLAKMAASFGCAKSSWQRYESGERAPPDDMLWALRAAYPDIPSFALPRAYPIRAPSESPIVSEPLAAPYRLSKRASRFDDVVWLPLYGADTDVPFRRDWLMALCGSTKGLLLVTAPDDSMAPMIREGAMVLVKERQSWLLGEAIYWVRIEGQTALRRVKRLRFEPERDGDGTIALHAEVSADAAGLERLRHERTFWSADEAQNTIIARAVWVGTKLE
ncbi:MAG: XRE family transcriptional regulator [Bosea sp. (in: a-proteobacteria)]